MANPNPISVELARSLISFDPDTGAITALSGSTVVSSTGYLHLRVGGKTYAAHRLAWALHTGQEPWGLVDHKNGDRKDNRAGNLRCVTRTQNNQNQHRAHRSNKHSTLMGATWHARDKRWVASISVQGKNKHIGCFSSAEEAHAAYIKAKRTLHEGCTL